MHVYMYDMCAYTQERKTESENAGMGFLGFSIKSKSNTLTDYT